MNKFSSYQIINETRNSTFQFFPCRKLPSKYPITTPFTFPFIGKEVVLCFDKNNQWNPLGGHMEPNENYQDTLIRESNEEAGVTIQRSSIKTIGYILNTNLESHTPSKYPSLNILPITISFISEIDRKWKPLETKERGVFRRKKAVELMKSRNDNHQMEEILEYVFQIFDEQYYQTNFRYIPNEISSDAPITQVFTFCKDKCDKFCIIRDVDEDFFSLPGGGCELNETPKDCIDRELEEEAQITCDKVKLLGSILVELTQKNKIISRYQHLRYLADINTVQKFIPQKNGFETIERKFVPISELKSKVMLLQNPNGDIILDQLKKIL